MQFGYGIPSQTTLKIPRLASLEGENELFCWDVQACRINWVSCLYAVNCATRYAVFLYRLPAGDYKKLEELIVEEICQQMLADGFTEEQAAAYLEKAGAVQETGLHQPHRSAETDRLLDLLGWHDDQLTDDSLGQPFLRPSLNKWLCCYTNAEAAPARRDGSQDLENGDYACPDQVMRQALGKIGI